MVLLKEKMYLVHDMMLKINLVIQRFKNYEIFNHTTLLATKPCL